MMERDFDHNPYSPDEERVARYFCDEIGIGGGDDPIGALLASHATMIQERKEVIDLLATLQQKRRQARRIMDPGPGQHVHHIDGDPNNNDPNNLIIVKKNEHRNVEMEGYKR